MNFATNILKLLWPQRWWHLPVDKKIAYFTFDDGPTPGVTDQVMNLLEEYGGRGTFFVVGEQASRHPELLREIKDRGHRIGNHSQTHLDGWKTPTDLYRKDISHAQDTLEEILGNGPGLFRPPYGKLRHRDARWLNNDFRIVMWDVLAWDWQAGRTPEQTSRHVLNKVRPGSIIVFHDSLKAASNALGALPKILKQLSTEGYQFNSLP